MKLVEFQNVSAYRGKVLALKGLSLSLPLGQSHAILGPNGSGKSTLIKLISREIYPVVSPSSYIKVLDTENITIWNLRKSIGLVSNDFQINFQSLATGKEVVLSAFFGSVGIRTHHSVSEEMISKAENIIHALDITHLSDRRFIQLSTGQQRRLLLARALVHQPKALLLDEPTAGLDLQARFWFINKMRELAKQGISIILVTHEPNEIIPEIKQLTLLKDGQVFKSGEKSEILIQKNLSELYDLKLSLTESNDYFHVSPAQ